MPQRIPARLRLLGFSTLAAACISCGQNPGSQGENAVRVRSRIQGGTSDTTDTGVVWIAAHAGGEVHHCTGVLIAPNLVLTAQHCVASAPPTISCGNAPFGATWPPSSFTVGTSATINTGATYGVSQVVTGEKADVCGNDIAVLILISPAGTGSPIEPRINQDPYQGEAFSAVGFGATSASSTASYGDRSRLDTGLSVTCVGGQCANTGIKWNEWNSLAGKTCVGDSGGPALDSQGRTIGIVTRGQTSGTNCVDTLYTTVSAWKTWLIARAQEASKKGGYPLPTWAVDTGGSGGSGGAANECTDGEYCNDASGKGDFECLEGGNAFPADAPACEQGAPCEAGYSCFVLDMSSDKGACLKDCNLGGAAGSAGSGGASCPSPKKCVDVTGDGDFQCMLNGKIPSDAPSCSSPNDCPSGWGCFARSSGDAVCLQDCDPNAVAGTGGAAGSGGSGDAGGTGGDPAGGAGPTGDAGSESGTAGSTVAPSADSSTDSEGGCATAPATRGGPLASLAALFGIALASLARRRS